MAEACTQDTTKVKKVVEAEEAIKANAKCLTNKEVQSKEEELAQVSPLEQNDDNNKKCLNSIDTFPSPTRCNKDTALLQNSKDLSSLPSSTDDNASKNDDSKDEIDNTIDVASIEQKKVQDNNSENENSNAAVFEEAEKSNEDAQVDFQDEKLVSTEQSTDNLESVIEEKNWADENEEKVIDNVEITKDNKDNINFDEEILQKEGAIELKKESIEKKVLEKVEGQLEVGIVGPPTAVSDLISEEELHGESALSAEEKVQDHVAEWVEKSVATESLITGEIEEEENEVPSNCRRRRRNHKNRRSRKKENNDIPVVSTRKSQRIVSNIIKRSIKW